MFGYFACACTLFGTVCCQLTSSVTPNNSDVSSFQGEIFDTASLTDTSENCTEDDDDEFGPCHLRQTNANLNNSNACTEDGGNVTVDVRNCEPVKGPRVSIMDQGILSRSQYTSVEIVCRSLFYPLLVSAVCVNIINIIVYTDTSMKSPTNTYLIALSVNELLFSILSTLRPILQAVYGVDAVKRQIYLISAMYISNFVLASLRRLMYCFTVLVSTERFLAVAFPLRARNFRLIKSPVIFIIAISVLCFACHLPGALKFDVVPKPNSVDYTIRPTYFYKHNKTFLTTFQLVIRVIYVYLVLLLGLLMNLLVLVALKMHTKNRQKMNTSVDAEKAAKREKQTTITILASTFLFTILALPLATDAIVQYAVFDYTLYRREHYLNMTMKEVNSVLLILSLSTDFIFYMLLSKAFRRTFFRRIPFMATFFRRQKYMKDSFRTQATNISSISGTSMREVRGATAN